MTYTIDNPKQVRYLTNPEEDNFTGVAKDKNNNIVYYLNGNFHREDGPARIWIDGAVEYYLNGKRHREDGPAIIYAYGMAQYYLNDKCHREDGPAIIYPDGSVAYYLNDKYLNISTDQELKDYLILRMFE